jgi:hypothetical protein
MRTGAERVRPARSAFFDEFSRFLQIKERVAGEYVRGTHVMLPRLLPSQSGDGWLTRPLSWARHEGARPVVSLSPAHARSLGVREGDQVVLRSRTGEAVVSLRTEARVPEGVVMAPPHYPEIRRLMRWRLDPALGDLDLQPSRVSIHVFSTPDPAA